MWSWCFRASLDTLFKIDPTRSADVLIAVLGTAFDGVLGSDYFSASRRYRREFGVWLQVCLAPLIRDVKFLTTLPEARDWASGEQLREALRPLFAVIHRREQLSAAAFQGPREAARAEGDALWHPGCASNETQSQPGETVGEARGELFPVPHDARGGADEHPGGTGDPVRGARPGGDAGDAERGGQSLVRADRDGDRDVRSARALGVRGSGGGGRGVVRWDGCAVAATRGLKGRGRAGGVLRCKVRWDRDVLKAARR
jgi:hypothetical protein